MIKTLQTIPFYIFLLPASFVLHGFIQHFGFISAADAGSLALTYCAFSGCVFLLSWLLFRNKRKAALMTAAWVGFYLFFGAVLDFLRVNAPFPFLYRYRFLIPILAILYSTTPASHVNMLALV